VNSQLGSLMQVMAGLIAAVGEGVPLEADQHDDAPVPLNIFRQQACGESESRGNIYSVAALQSAGSESYKVLAASGARGLPMMVLSESGSSCPSVGPSTTMLWRIEVYSLRDGRARFASSGDDGMVRIYDGETMAEVWCD
jgi:hypothetical protein